MQAKRLEPLRRVIAECTQQQISNRKLSYENLKNFQEYLINPDTLDVAYSSLIEYTFAERERSPQVIPICVLLLKKYMFQYIPSKPVLQEIDFFCSTLIYEHKQLCTKRTAGDNSSETLSNLTDSVIKSVHYVKSLLANYMPQKNDSPEPVFQDRDEKMNNFGGNHYGMREFSEIGHKNKNYYFMDGLNEDLVDENYLFLQLDSNFVNKFNETEHYFSTHSSQIMQKCLRENYGNNNSKQNSNLLNTNSIMKFLNKRIIEKQLSDVSESKRKKSVHSLNRTMKTLAVRKKIRQLFQYKYYCDQQILKLNDNDIEEIFSCICGYDEDEKNEKNINKINKNKDEKSENNIHKINKNEKEKSEKNEKENSSSNHFHFSSEKVKQNQTLYQMNSNLNLNSNSNSNSEHFNIIGSVLIKMIVDMYLNDKSSATVLLFCLLQSMLECEEECIRVRSFDLILNLVNHGQLLNSPFLSFLNQPFSEETVFPFSDEKNDMDEKIKNENLKSIFEFEFWLLTLLSEMLLILVQKEEPSEIVWISGLSCLFHLLISNGLLIKSRAKLIDIRVVNVLIEKGIENEWSKEITLKLINLLIFILYNNEKNDEKNNQSQKNTYNNNGERRKINSNSLEKMDGIKRICYFYISFKCITAQKKLFFVIFDFLLEKNFMAARKEGRKLPQDEDIFSTIYILYFSNIPKLLTRAFMFPTSSKETLALDIADSAISRLIPDFSMSHHSSTLLFEIFTEMDKLAKSFTNIPSEIKNSFCMDQNSSEFLNLAKNNLEFSNLAQNHSENNDTDKIEYNIKNIKSFLSPCPSPSPFPSPSPSPSPLSFSHQLICQFFIVDELIKHYLKYEEKEEDNNNEYNVDDDKENKEIQKINNLFSSSITSIMNELLLSKNVQVRKTYILILEKMLSFLSLKTILDLEKFGRNEDRFVTKVKNKVKNDNKYENENRNEDNYENRNKNEYKYERIPKLEPSNEILTVMNYFLTQFISSNEENKSNNLLMCYLLLNELCFDISSSNYVHLPSSFSSFLRKGEKKTEGKKKERENTTHKKEKEKEKEKNMSHFSSMKSKTLRISSLSSLSSSSPFHPPSFSLSFNPSSLSSPFHPSQSPNSFSFHSQYHSSYPSPPSPSPRAFPFQSSSSSHHYYYSPSPSHFYQPSPSPSHFYQPPPSPSYYNSPFNPLNPSSHSSPPPPPSPPSFSRSHSFHSSPTHYPSLSPSLLPSPSLHSSPSSTFPPFLSSYSSPFSPSLSQLFLRGDCFILSKSLDAISTVLLYTPLMRLAASTTDVISLSTSVGSQGGSCADVRCVLLLLLLAKCAREDDMALLEVGGDAFFRSLLDDPDCRISYISSSFLLKRMISNDSDIYQKALHKLIYVAQQADDEKVLENPYLQIQGIFQT